MTSPFSRSRRAPWLMSGAIVMLSLLCLLTALTYFNFRRLAEANQWNVHTYRVLDQLSTLRANLIEEESRLRAFALLHNPDFLLKARGNAQSGAGALRQLQFLTRDNREQERRLKAFALGYDAWRVQFRAINATNLDLAASRVAAQTPARRLVLERLRNQLGVMQSVERDLLRERARQQEISQRSTSQSLLFASFATIVVVGVSLLLLRAQTRALELQGAEMRRSRDQLKAVLDNAPLILYALDSHEKFTVMEGKGLEKIGLSRENAIGKSFVEVIGTDYDMNPVRAALRGQSSVSKTHFRGAVFEMNRRPLRDESGQITGMMSVGVDITERDAAEQALRESERRYRSVIEGVQEVIFQLDRDGKWRFLNPAWRVLLGHDTVASLGRSCLDFIHRDDRARIEKHLESMAEGETNLFQEELRFLSRDGDLCWLDAQAQAQHDASGHYLGVAGTLNDVTQRKLATETLLVTTQLQRAILDGAPYAIIATAPNGIITSFNRAAEKMLGYSCDEVCGVMSPKQFHDAEEVLARAAEMSQEIGRTIGPEEVLIFNARAGLIEEREWIHVRRDGSRFPVRVSISALHAADSTITGYVGIAHDLSETRRAEKLKNEFVSVVSHELRTPLTSIRGALGLLAGGVAGELPSGARQMIDIAQKNSDRLVLLINDILDIEKIESGKMRFDLRPLALRELLQNAIEQNIAYAQTWGVDLKLENAEALNAMQVMGDENRLQQVLSNLLSNACKFTPSGGAVHLSAQKNGAMVRVLVRDEGEGVSSEFLPRLFEKFAQADSSSTRKQGGTGLGLPISRAIVEKHGGILDYLLTPDQSGATFFFDLPLVVVPESPTAPEKRPLVLICEDDEEVAAHLGLMIAQDGYDTDIAATLAEARQMLKTGNYAGMTLDLVLPDGDGLEFLAELRADEARRDFPVVVVSAFCEAGKLRGEVFGVIDWLCKPIDTARLRASLAQFGREGGARVLHVEDDADVRRVTALILGDSAHLVAAPSLREAREQLQNGRFDLAILDIGLPDGSGLELLPLLSSCTPPVPVILFSASEASCEEARAVTASLVKSRTDNQTLRETIGRCLNEQA